MSQMICPVAKDCPYIDSECDCRIEHAFARGMCDDSAHDCPACVPVADEKQTYVNKHNHTGKLEIVVPVPTQDSSEMTSIQKKFGHVVGLPDGTDSSEKAREMLSHKLAELHGYDNLDLLPEDDRNDFALKIDALLSLKYPNGKPVISVNEEG